jgi:hypothetical protein
MKTTVNFEWTNDEVEKLAVGILTRVAAKLLGELTISPHFQTGVLEGLRIVSDYASRMQPPSGGTIPRAQHLTGMPPWLKSIFGPAAGNNVRPIGGEPPHIVNCFPIEATRSMEAGWGCCTCATYNVLERPACRHCGHARCTPIVPPETPQPPPNGPTP